jgi:pyruvate dehydrogenase E2 component (dihydrolipoamide acetyltransferase)
MAEVIRMPKMSDTMTEGVIVAWHKKVGDDVKSGDILAEVETDKATMELENYVKGTLLHIGIEQGKAVPVDAVIAVVGAKGEDISALLSSANTAKPAAIETKNEAVATTAQPQANQAKSNTNDQRLKASPLAKKLAEDKGIDISKIAGTGDMGRIVKRDIETYTDKPQTTIFAPVTGKESYTEVAVSQMRKAIARRLSESKNGAPHFYLTMSICMDKTIAARKSMNENGQVKVSVNDIIIKAVAAALRRHPQVNSSWLGDKIRMNQHIHVGVAVAIDDGLIVPVVKFADSKSISHISQEVKELADKAKHKKLQPTEFEGSTFTISNLGMYGIDEFTAIINPPESCILAVGAAKETVVAENGQMKIANMMKVTLSCDHRSVDGAVGSAFLQTLKELLEEPVKILL